MSSQREPSDCRSTISVVRNVLAGGKTDDRLVVVAIDGSGDDRGACCGSAEQTTLIRRGNMVAIDRQVD